MNRWALLLLLFYAVNVRATVSVAPGVSVTGAHRSDQTDRNGKELVTIDAAPGISFEVEWSIFNDYLGLTGGFLWRGSPAEVQYSYTNPNNPLDTATVPDLKTNSSSFTGLFGARLRLLNLKYFKIYGGGGWAPGVLYLNYNENKFTTVTGSTIGFKEKEDQNTQGIYLEAGMELYSTKGGALRLLGRRMREQTGKFQTLGNRRLNLTSSNLTLQYLHLF